MQTWGSTTNWSLVHNKIKLKKDLVYKNQRQEPIDQKYKANESTSKHNPKRGKKTEANNQWKIRKKKPYANKTQGYKMMINDNKEDLRWKNSHLPQIN
jgi:hypothetical protein